MIRSIGNVAKSEEVEQELAELRRRIAESLESELQPPAFVPFGLEKAIRSHVERFQQKNPEIDVHLEWLQDGQLFPEQTQLNLYHIYQQAMSNVLRHARASRIDVLFQMNKERIVLEIQDYGRGFKMPPRWIVFAREGQLGLAGAAERAVEIGGIFEVESKQGKGTLIRVTVTSS